MCYSQYITNAMKQEKLCSVTNTESHEIDSLDIQPIIMDSIEGENKWKNSSATLNDKHFLEHNLEIILKIFTILHNVFNKNNTIERL